MRNAPDAAVEMEPVIRVIHPKQHGEPFRWSGTVMDAVNYREEHKDNRFPWYELKWRPTGTLQLSRSGDQFADISCEELEEIIDFLEL